MEIFIWARNRDETLEVLLWQLNCSSGLRVCVWGWFMIIAIYFYFHRKLPALLSPVWTVPFNPLPVELWHTKLWDPLSPACVQPSVWMLGSAFPCYVSFAALFSNPADPLLKLQALLRDGEGMKSCRIDVVGCLESLLFVPQLLTPVHLMAFLPPVLVCAVHLVLCALCAVELLHYSTVTFQSAKSQFQSMWCWIMVVVCFLFGCYFLHFCLEKKENENQRDERIFSWKFKVLTLTDKSKVLVSLRDTSKCGSK